MFICWDRLAVTMILLIHQTRAYQWFCELPFVLRLQLFLLWDVGIKRTLNSAQYNLRQNIDYDAESTL
jgi:hypothetical protein